MTAEGQAMTAEELALRIYEAACQWNSAGATPKENLLPYARAFLAMQDSMTRIKSDGDYSGFEEALAQADALLEAAHER